MCIKRTSRCALSGHGRVQSLHIEGAPRGSTSRGTPRVSPNQRSHPDQACLGEPVPPGRISAGAASLAPLVRILLG